MRSLCLQKAVREVAAAERLQWQPPAEQARVHRWDVSFHEGCQRDTEKWPRDVRDGLHEKCSLLRERGPQLAYPLVTPVAGSADLSFTRLRLYAAGGAIASSSPGMIVGTTFFWQVERREGPITMHYQDMKARATSRIRGYPKHPG